MISLDIKQLKIDLIPIGQGQPASIAIDSLVTLNDVAEDRVMLLN